MQKQNRRTFITNGTRLAGVALGAAVVGSGIAAINGGEGSMRKFRDTRCGDEGATKVLVAYASRLGATVEIAEAISEGLCGDDTVVETKWVNHVENIDAYDAVIIGSAIRYDKWLPEASDFMQRHQKALANMPVALFFSCLNITRKTEKARREVEAYAQALEGGFPGITPLSIGRFAGVLDYKTMPYWARPLARGLFAILGVAEGDYRDWQAIGQWAEKVKPALLNA